MKFHHKSKHLAATGVLASGWLGKVVADHRSVLAADASSLAGLFRLLSFSSRSAQRLGRLPGFWELVTRPWCVMADMLGRRRTSCHHLHLHNKAGRWAA